MTDYQKRFFHYLTEQDDAERAAMVDSLDDETNPAEFDTDTTPVADPDADLSFKAAQIKSQQSAEMRETLTAWIAKCDDFLVFLNGTEESSIQSRLSKAEADTIFDRMKQSEQRKIARVATELASLTESFRGYIAQTENPQFKYV